MDSNSREVKSGRVSKMQRRRLLELMKQHRHVGKGQFITKDAKQNHKTIWEAVANELNAMGGPFKKAEQWKKSWIDWKSSVKQLYGSHRAFQNRTGNLPASQGPRPIEGIDKEVLDFFSKDVSDGDGHTVEAGLEIVTVVEPEVDAYDVVYMDESTLEDFEDNSAVPVIPEKKTKTREPSSQSCLEEVKKLCGENQVQIMNGLNRIIQSMETQNKTLAQMLRCLQNKD